MATLTRTRLSLIGLFSVLMLCTVAPAAEPTTKSNVTKKSAPTSKSSKVNVKQLDLEVQKAIAFLAAAQQEDGSYQSKVGPGITALITTALLRHGRTTKDPQVAKSLKYLESFVQPDGAIHHPKSRLPTYETCLAIMCFQEANSDGHYNEIIKKADAALKGIQKSGDDGKDKSNVEFGGAGYGGQGRPDLSNTHFLVEALRAAGTSADDPAIQNALIFVSRCQNHESEHNTTAMAAKVEDGGFYYTPVGDGDSPAGKTANGGLRSYGAMTYAGLKSMLYAGVDANDPRVKAAVTWVRKNYDVTSNPGLGQAGLYYYYHTFAKALDALGDDNVTDEKGKKHDWKQELVVELAKRQQPNGSWINSDPKWMEGDANLSTGFALLALSYCRP